MRKASREMDSAFAMEVLDKAPYILFGLAKTCQYSGLTILGVEGYNRLKNWIKRRKDDGEDYVYHRAYYIPKPREPNFDRLCHYCATKNGFFCTKNEV